MGAGHEHGAHVAFDADSIQQIPEILHKAARRLLLK